MKVIPVVLAFTSNYLVPAATTLLSILDSLDKKYNLEVICLLSEDLNDRGTRLLESLSKDRVSFRYLNLKGILDHIYINPRFSEAATYRLMLPEILGNYDKIIYLDCDIIVRTDLGKLFNDVSLGTNYVAAVYEATLPFQEDYVRSLGCIPGEYFNSGFLIMNLDQMRIEKLSEKLLKSSDNTELQFPDQDALNIHCKGRVKSLNPIYNSIRTFFLPQYKSSFLKYYSEADWRSVQEQGNIHFTGSKPWDNYTVKFDSWWSVYYKLPLELRGLGGINSNVERLYHFYKIKLGKCLFDILQFIVRKVRQTI